MTSSRTPPEQQPCSLCGHAPSCGMASVWDGKGDEHVRHDLCHDDDHSCYHLWTVYRMRNIGKATPPYLQRFLPPERRAS